MGKPCIFLKTRLAFAQTDRILHSRCAGYEKHYISSAFDEHLIDESISSWIWWNIVISTPCATAGFTHNYI